MLLLTPGPVEMEAAICEIGGLRKLPYFRGPEFTRAVIHLTQDLKYLFQTEGTPLIVTASGTGLMEMAIVNLLNRGDRAVVLNGGTFGGRWVGMCRAFGVDVVDFPVELGRSPDIQKLQDCLDSRPKALLVNAHETSTGYLYDIQLLGRMTESRGIMLIVDAVSTIGADDFKMDDWHVDCALVSSQKALALMPGLGFIAFGARAMEVIPRVTQPRAYFDALNYLVNISRGMTPFTPAVVGVLQAQARMGEIRGMGIDEWILRCEQRARTFRQAMLSAGYTPFPERCSNAMTAVRLPEGVVTSNLVTHLRERYNWWLATNGTNREDYLRVSHMGNLPTDVMCAVADGIAQGIRCLREGGRQ